ncbi:MAG: hypothetical protein M3Y13_01775 [Armatimonadota bacterium]|nr:hypothetical protein [Armatimonadota bacterium]
MHFGTLVRVVLAVGFASLTAGGAYAAPAPAEGEFHARIGAKSWATPHGLVARVLVNDQPVATLQVPSGGYTPAQRAVVIRDRLAGLVDAGLTPSQIAVVPLGRDGCDIRGRGERIIMVSPRDGRAQHQSARRLAASWAKTLKARLADPALTLGESRIILPLGAARVLTVGGAARSEDIRLTGGDSLVSPAAFDAASRRITLRGARAGEARLLLQAGGAEKTFTVSVRPYAAIVQPRVTVRVTGRPIAPASLVQTAVYLGLKRAISAADGAQLRLLRAPRLVGSLRPGASVTRRLSVRVAGPYLLPVEAEPVITVLNQPLPPARAEAMFYSNNPEQVKQSQTLFTGPLSPFRPVRLDYHHQNRAGALLVFHTDLVNASDQTASVHVMEGIAQPEIDTVQIGRRAGAAFLQALDSGTGLVIDVPAHARVPLLVQRFAPLLTVSGIVQLQQISGPDHALSLSVVADEDRQALVSSPSRLATKVGETEGADARLVAAPAAPLATGIVHETSPFVFGAPLVSLTGDYAVGGQWVYLRLGHGESLRNAAGTERLWGNYGVSYFVTVRLKNPTDQTRNIGVFFAPEAGPAAGVFQVSGQPQVECDPLLPPEEKELTRVRLNPGETRTVRLRTILLNGSAYPASLVVHVLKAGE